MNEYNPRLLKKLCVYENGRYIEIDFSPEYLTEDEVDSYLAKNLFEQPKVKTPSENSE